MNVSFGICLDCPTVINKQKVSVTDSRSCELKAGSSIIRPTLILKVGSSDNLSEYNYAYIPNWGRYYYITDVIYSTAARAEVSLMVDPLYSFKDYLNAQEVYISKIGNAGLRAAYLVDPEYPITQQTYNQVINASVPANDPINATGRYILTVVGGTIPSAPTP